MRFLITMNMASANGFLVHQLTIEIPVDSCESLKDLLNEEEFITGRLYYRRRALTMETIWEDRGDMVLNTAHIGKAQEFFEMERDANDESQGYFKPSNLAPTGEGATVRKRRGVF
jgi:hypothetical protein